MNKKSILFYVLAFLFLLISIYMAVMTYLSLAASASQYDISLAAEWGVVLQNIIASAGGFLAFACIFCGIAMLLSQNTNVTKEVLNTRDLSENKE